MPERLVVAALYCFCVVDAPHKKQKATLAHCQQAGIKGTLLLAEEGINGTIAGTRAAIDSVMAYLHAHFSLENMEYKESFAYENPFLRMKVKLKREIVTIGDCSVNPAKMVGEYVEPEDWNELLNDPNVVVIDTRNDYECAIGTFKGALDPHTQTFRQFPQFVLDNLHPKKNTKVAMFCTGGIRCEKASSYMMQQGFEKVYHLKGGILKYLEVIPEADSLWEGECFVFDERISVKHGLALGSYDQCYGCRHPITAADKASDVYVRGVSCPYCAEQTTAEQKARFEQRQVQIDLAKERGDTHLGVAGQ